MSQPPAGGPSVAALFDDLAETYDRSGVDFFQPVGARLVELLAPAAGARALDIGCGRGAVTLPLARAVGGSGAVLALDVSPAMVAATGAEVAAAGLANTTTLVADAGALPDGGPYDVIASSLVLFFLPEPAAALGDWVSHLASGGRIGVSTFGPLDETSRALDALFEPWLPQGLLDARTSGTQGPFSSDDGMIALMRGAGAGQVDNVVEPAYIRFEDVAAWRRFSMTTGQRAMWRQVPEEERPGLLERAAALLDAVRGDDGASTLVWQMRYTLGSR